MAGLRAWAVNWPRVLRRRPGAPRDELRSPLRQAPRARRVVARLGDPRRRGAATTLDESSKSRTAVVVRLEGRRYGPGRRFDVRLSGIRALRGGQRSWRQSTWEPPGGRWCRLDVVLGAFRGPPSGRFRHRGIDRGDEGAFLHLEDSEGARASARIPPCSVPDTEAVANVFTPNTSAPQLPVARDQRRGLARTCSRATPSRHGSRRTSDPRPDGKR